MRRLFKVLVGWIVRYCLWFLMLVVLLVGASWLRKEVSDLETASSGIATLKQAEANIQAHRRAMEGATVARIGQLGSGSLDKLDARITAIGRRITALSSEQTLLGFDLSSLTTAPVGERVVAHFRRAIELELLTQERDYLVDLRSILATRAEQESAARRLEELRLAHAKVHKALAHNMREQERLRQENPVRAWLLGFPEYAKHVELRRAQQTLADENGRAHRAYLAQKKIVGGTEPRRERPNFSLRTDRIHAVFQPLHAAIEHQEARAVHHWIARASGPFSDAAPVAGWILLSIVMLPVGVKTLFYFVLAPMASRRPAIHLLPEASGAIGRTDITADGSNSPRKISSVSHMLTISEDEELLVHSRYIQSASVGGRKNTKWLMDWSFPLSSLAAGLLAMTRVEGDRSGAVVVSATDDPLMEVAIVSLPNGSAIVLQPRSLVGVVYRKGKPVRITRHWRLGSLHAWLTLQLRYLVFHGDATLIVRGCRGVRIEAAGTGRSINQAATIGFAANVAYRTIRTETFWPYLIGKQALFNDSFAGDSGFYLYEETPHGGQNPGIAGRGLDGLTDSILKVFGI